MQQRELTRRVRHHLFMQAILSCVLSALLAFSLVPARALAQVSVSGGATASESGDSTTTSESGGSATTSEGGDSDPYANPLETFSISTESALPAGEVGSAYRTTSGALFKFALADIPTDATVLWSIAADTSSTDAVSAPVRSTLDGGLTWYWEGGGLPTGLRLMEATGEIEGTPTLDESATYPLNCTFSVTASAKVVRDVPVEYEDEADGSGETGDTSGGTGDVSGTGDADNSGDTSGTSGATGGTSDTSGSGDTGGTSDTEGGQGTSDEPEMRPVTFTHEVTKSFSLEITYVAPPEYVSVPDVGGKNAQAAGIALRKAGLKNSQTTASSETVPAGCVISQSPAAGEQALKGSTVSLVISSGSASRPAEPEVATLDVYAYRVNSAGAYVDLLSPNGRVAASDGTWEVPGGITTKGGQVRLCAVVGMSNGATYNQSKANCPDLGITWTSSDPLVATVSSKGIVTASNNGYTTITAKSPSGKTCSIGVTVIGQGEAYPQEVRICDENGREYGNDRITFSEIDANYLQLYARVVDSEGNTVSNAPNAADYNPRASVFETLTWYTTNTQAGYISNTTGTFVPKEYSTLKVYAQVTGGDPSFNKGVVSGYVWVVIDSGVYNSEFDPSEELQVRVTYNSKKEYTAFERTLSLSELRSHFNSLATYTLTRDDGEYVTASARGVYLNDLFEYLKIKTNDVEFISVVANDGANPGLISREFLFRERYWFPYIEYGGNTIGAVRTYPMLAYESNWRDSSRGSIGSGEDYDSIDGGTCFRLLFGSETLADNATSRSIKFIYSLTIYLTGEPPTNQGGGDDPYGNKGQGQGQGTGTGTGTGNGSGTGSGSGNGLGAGTGEGGADGTSTQGDAGGAQTDAASSGEAGGGASAGSSGASGGEFKIYQMMSNAETSFDLEDWSNPYKSFAIPLAIILVLIGAAQAALWYRKQRKCFHSRNFSSI